MRQTLILRFLLRSRLVLARRGHGGVAQAQKELGRLALLEQSMMHSAAERARQTPPVTQAAAAVYLREVPDLVERARAAVTGEAVTGSTTITILDSNLPAEHSSNAGTSPSRSRTMDEPQVSNLTQFLSMCKQLKIRFSSDSDAASRRRGREALCAFWAHHASSAIACCYQGVREVGFVADYGLADTGMHLHLPELWAILRILKTERAVASSFDATRILQYLARELQYMERGRLSSPHHRSTAVASTDDHLLSSSDLLAFRQALTDLAVDLLAFYFVVHNPSINALSHLTGEGGESTGQEDNDAPASSSYALSSDSRVSIATAIDALSGLEVLAVLSTHDATQETLTSVWEHRHLSSLRPQRESSAQLPSIFLPDITSLSSSAALAHEVQYLLVAELFRFAAMQWRDLRLTDVVHGFALLRVHLRTLWPPYARYSNNKDAVDSSSNDVQIDDERKKSADHKAVSMNSPSATTARRLPLWYEKDTLFRVTWGLAVALVSKDRKLVSPYHYVKIVTTLAKLPAFVLAPTPLLKKELKRIELPKSATVGMAQLNSDAETPDDEDDLQDEALSILSEIPPEQRKQPQPRKEEEEKAEATVALRPADFWRFIVSKACVFVPNLPPDQRRVVCRSLHLAITEKRGHLLRNSEQMKGLHPHPAVPSQHRGVPSKFGRTAAVRFTFQQGAAAHSDDAADILLPLVEEMATYTESYAACIQDTRQRAVQRLHRQGSSGDAKWKDKR